MRKSFSFPESLVDEALGRHTHARTHTMPLRLGVRRGTQKIGAQCNIWSVKCNQSDCVSLRLMRGMVSGNTAQFECE